MLAETRSKQGKNVKSLQKIQSEVEQSNKIALSVDCVIFGFDESKLKVMEQKFTGEEVAWATLLNDD